MNRNKYLILHAIIPRHSDSVGLAVVLDAEGLDGAAMQAIAAEFNHPETVFVLPAIEPAHRARARIFTPARELPFAGHPTVGTAVLLALHDGLAVGSELVLEEGVGPVNCRVEARSAEGGAASFVLPQLPAAVAGVPDDAGLAAALGLSPADIGCGRLRPARWSAGIPITFVPVRGLAAVRACRPDPAQLVATAGEGPVYVICSEAAELGHQLHARMFAPAFGITEDPATGSAVAALAGLLAADRGLADGEHAIAVEQDYEMGRPSIIRLTVNITGGALCAASVGGAAVLVTEGTLLT
jgi:trans-2,3-dihydro-3-hydroxyanthranilate isomerase